jgi:hypothetical protein
MSKAAESKALVEGLINHLKGTLKGAWKDALKAIVGACKHSNEYDDSSLIRLLCEEVDQMNQPDMIKAFKAVAEYTAAVHVRIDKADEKWIATRKKKAWKELNDEVLTRRIAEVEEKGLRHYVPKKTASAGKGGSRNSEVTEGPYAIECKGLGEVMTTIAKDFPGDEKLVSIHEQIQTLLAEAKEHLSVLNSVKKSMAGATVIKQDTQAEGEQEVESKEAA